MKFHELKKQAEADGMTVTAKTNKADIEAYYEGKETVEIVQAETVVEPEAPVNTGCRHVLQGEDAYEFSYSQAVRAPSIKLEDGRTQKGEIMWKKVYVCTLCGEKELRDE